MSDSDDALFIQLEGGSPRDRRAAGSELARRGGSAIESRLAARLASADDALACELLRALGAMKLAAPSTLDAVLLRASSKNARVRQAVAACLLHASPSLGAHVERVRELATREADEGAREAFRRVLARYRS